MDAKTLLLYVTACFEAGCAGRDVENPARLSDRFYEIRPTTWIVLKIIIQILFQPVLICRVRKYKFIVVCIESVAEDHNTHEVELTERVDDDHGSVVGTSNATVLSHRAALVQHESALVQHDLI